MLGTATDSGDAEGREYLSQCRRDVGEAAVQQALEAFRGEIEQVPSMYSAIKQNGQPLYKLARQGIEVERKPRRGD